MDKTYGLVDRHAVAKSNGALVTAVHQSLAIPTHFDSEHLQVMAWDHSGNYRTFDLVSGEETTGVETPKPTALNLGGLGNMPGQPGMNGMTERSDVLPMQEISDPDSYSEDAGVRVQDLPVMTVQSPAQFHFYNWQLETADVVGYVMNTQTIHRAEMTLTASDGEVIIDHKTMPTFEMLLPPEAGEMKLFMFNDSVPLPATEAASTIWTFVSLGKMHKVSVSSKLSDARSLLTATHGKCTSNVLSDRTRIVPTSVRSSLTIRTC